MENITDALIKELPSLIIKFIGYAAGLLLMFLRMRWEINQLKKDFKIEQKAREEGDRDVRAALSEGVKAELNHGAETMVRLDGEIKKLDDDKQDKTLCDERHKKRRKGD